MNKYSRPSRMPRSSCCKSWAIAVLVIGISCDALAGISTDNSLGRPAQTLTGPNYLIPETLGKLSGSNLFHSFQTFNISTGESANFATATPGIANVISRVTGGSRSQINGLLKLTSASGMPNLFFINPAGITFGAGASIDVPGALHVSTANTIKFQDGDFHADLNQASTFSSAPPEAFGFLGATRASITVTDGAALATLSSQPISIIAGDVEVNKGTVSTLGGDIRVVALGQRAQVIGFTGALPAVNGNLGILNSGQIFSSASGSANGGSIKVAAGSMTLDGQGLRNARGQGNTYILSSTLGSGNAGNVDVSVAGAMSMVNGSRIASETYSSGQAGLVKVAADSINIDGLGYVGVTGISSDAFPANNATATGNAGGVDVSVTGGIALTHGGIISADTYSSGNAGSIKVSAGTISMNGQGSTTGIRSDARPFSTGHAGNIDVSTTGNISIVNNGAPPPIGVGISSSTYSSGNAGTVKVRAGSIFADGYGSNMSGIFSVALPFTGSAGNAGTVDVSVAGDITLNTGGNIGSSTFTAGNAGSVSVSAGNITIGTQGSIQGIPGVTGTTGVFSVALPTSSGNAGSVDVTASGNISIVNNSDQPIGVGISSGTFGPGNAGSVRVSTGTLVVDGHASIDAATMATYSGQIGSVSVIASDSIMLSNMAQIAISNAAIAANPDNLTQTTLSVLAPNITLNNAKINATSTGNVSASDIEIRSSNQLFIDPSIISTGSSLGSGGSINTQGGNLINLINSQITTSVLGITGNGGNIAVAANTLILNTGFIQANTTAANAIGGTVSIAVQNLISSGNTLFIGGSTPYAYQPGIFGFNVIQAAAPTGLSGTVQTTSPVLDISGSLGGLYAQVIDTGGLSRSPCQATGGSSLTQSGRGGLPPSARGLLRAELVLPPMKISNHVVVGGDYLRVALSNWGCS